MKQLVWRLLNAAVHRAGGRAGTLTVRRQGLTWRLRPGHFLDRSILIHGKFETRTTRRLRAAVWPGFKLVDVGANFGYYTLLTAKLAGPAGRVWAFEPSAEFRRRLWEHIEINGLQERVQVLDYGLSDTEGEGLVSVFDSSATLHPVAGGPSDFSERIALRPLDAVAAELGIAGVDLIKVDIDGHEPRFLAGARQLLRRDRPVLVIEFSQINLDSAGSDVRELRERLLELDYELYSDLDGRPYADRTRFLVECGNYTHSANVWAVPRERPDLRARFQLG